jgi:protein phosphatase 1 regulatory subunit 11
LFGTVRIILLTLRRRVSTTKENTPNILCRKASRALLCYSVPVKGRLGRSSAQIFIPRNTHFKINFRFQRTMSSPIAPAPSSPGPRSSTNTARSSPRPRVPVSTRHLAPGAAGPSQRRAVSGSATQTITPEGNLASRSASPESLVLRLRGAHDASSSQNRTSPRRRIQWAEDVIDNEGLGRKSSKVCCIYHKTREFGESSSEEESSSDESSDDAGGSDSPDDGGARMSGNRRGKCASRQHKHSHGADDDCGHGRDHGKPSTKRKPSPNAYERIPKHNVKPDMLKS